MKNFVRLSFSLLFIGLLGQINAQCEFDSCPPDMTIDVGNDACDGSSSTIENDSGFAYDLGGTGGVLDQSAFESIPGSPSVMNCNGDELYGYTDNVIQLGGDCQGDGYYSFFERTWEIFDASGAPTSEFCVQTIFLMDFERPVIFVNATFFEDQHPDAFVISTNNCPVNLTWTDPVIGVDILDNCSMTGEIDVQMSGGASGDDFNGQTTICYTYTDACGNAAPPLCFDILLDCVSCSGTGTVYEDCNDPPVLCDLDIINQISSCTPDYDGTPGVGLCNNGVINNPSYISFVAGDTDLDFTIYPTNCTTVPGGNGPVSGVQATVIDPCDPGTCYSTNGANCNTTTFQINASGLTIGNIYQLVVDGCAGSECEYQIQIDSAPPFVISDPEDPVANVDNPASCNIDVNDIQICPGTAVTFYPDNFQDADFYFCWDIDNQNGVTALNNSLTCTVATGGGSFSCGAVFSSCGELQLSFDQVGSYELCLVEMDNGCDNLVPSNYCFQIEVEESVDVDFGSYAVCEADLLFFVPPATNGEQWQGPTGGALDLGANVYQVEDDCDCNYDQLVEITVLPAEATMNVQVEQCEYFLDSWVDANNGLEWDDIQSYVSSSNPYIFEGVFVDQGSTQVGWDTDNCDILINYEFIVYDIPGVIVQTNGSACEATLCFETSVDFPGFMNESGIGYQWVDPSGDIIALADCVIVTTAQEYTINMSYVMDNGVTCDGFSASYLADLSGSAPSQPVFTASPTTACASQSTGLVYSVADSPGSTYTWSITNGTQVSGGTTNQIVVDVIDTTQPMVVSVFADSNTCGTSDVAMTTLTIVPEPVVTLGAVPDVCVGTIANLTSVLTVGSASVYNWTVDDATADFPGINNNLETLPVTWNTPGVQNYSLSVIDASGCQSATITGMVNVVAELAPPTGTCTVENSNSVTIEWTDVPGQTTIVTSSMPGTQTGNTFTVGTLTAGQTVTFDLVTDGTGYPCGNSVAFPITCTASTCTVNPTIVPPTAEQLSICLDGGTAPFQLNAQPTGGEWTGPGVTIGGLFDPASAPQGDHVITYTVTDPIQACTGADMVTISTYDIPNATFTLSANEVCIGEAVTVIYDGMPPEITDWTYTGSGMNPINILINDFEISYSQGGMKVVNLEVTNGACMLDTELEITVFPALPEPIVSCTSTPTSVDFSWDAIPGVIEYVVDVTSGGVTTSTSQATTTMPVGGLTDGDVVDIQVTAIDPNGCQNSITVDDCTAQTCPVYTVTLDAGADGPTACWDPIDMPVFMLTQMVVDDLGGQGTEPGNWSGPAGLDELTGIFVAPGIGDYTIAYNYADVNNCQGVGFIDISVFDSPNGSFITDVTDLCLGDELTLILDDPYVGGLDYLWTADTDASNYTLVDNTDDTFTVIFSNDPGGDVEFTLIVDAGNCQSNSFSASAEVISPLDFNIQSLVECYDIDNSIELGPFDGNGNIIDGSWEIVGGGPLPASTFSPSAVDDIYELIFTEANCGVLGMIEVEIVAKPSLTIGPLTQTICISELASVTIDTDFYPELVHDVGVLPLDGLGTDFTIDYDAPGLGPGTYTYTSFVDRPGDCDSDEITWEVIVEDIPQLPTISCIDQDLTSVTFGWTTVPCAESYIVSIMGGPGGEMFFDPYTDTDITVDNLSQGDELDISVLIVSSRECEFTAPLMTTCSAMSCEPATVTIGNEIDTEYCISDLPAPFSLTATVAGVDIDDSGIFTFSGAGISSDGMVDLSTLVAGDYSINVLYEEDGCDYSSDVSYSILAAPGAIFTIVEAPCPEALEGMVNIVPQGNGPFIVDSGQSLVEGDNSLPVGNHTITITDGNGCVYEETITVGQAAAPNVNFVVPEMAFTGQDQVFSLDLGSVALDNVIWTIDGVEVLDADCASIDCNTYELTPDEERIYTVCVQAFYGTCIYEDCLEMNARELRIENIYVPNIFDPNDPNPMNSTLNMYVESREFVVKDISIFDRWGNRVHNDEEEKIGTDGATIVLWDGKFENGGDYIPGVYIYVVEMLFEEGFTEYLTGDMTIVD